MPDPTSIAQIDLSPIPGKTYFTLVREWREEFIYFLLVDRFQDDTPRAPVLSPNRTLGIATPDNFYGGKIRGILNNLDYIAGLGCTCVWLSPVFENNAGAYHGYNINNYLSIDPNFGTKQDLVDLVAAAHSYQKNGQPYPIRVVLDVVTNHSGDNWQYPFNATYNYFQDQQFPFDAWRRADRPIPSDLMNPDYYHRRGNISSANGYDTYPEMQHGDLSGLKDFANDDDQIGSQVINILIAAHCYWIRETDVDGFRMDAIKHMGELACSRFCSNIREYAYSLGKRGFFLFGELASADDEIIDRYIGQNTSVVSGDQTVFFGIDSVLDFRLAEGNPANPPLRDVIKQFADPGTLFRRLEAQQNRALNRGEIGRYLVTFVDNHDSFWQPGRFGAGAPNEQIIAAIGYLICSLGTACIYYGTEQGFQGSGGDNQMREAMFDLATPGRNLLNTDCAIYQEIAKIAQAAQELEPLKYGRMYFRQIGDGVSFGLPFGTDYTLAFSRILYPREVLVAYNVSALPRNDCVIIDAAIHHPGDNLTFVYGGVGAVAVQQAPDGSLFVRLPLSGRQFVILE